MYIGVMGGMFVSLAPQLLRKEKGKRKREEKKRGGGGGGEEEKKRAFAHLGKLGSNRCAANRVILVPFIKFTRL